MPGYSVRINYAFDRNAPCALCGRKNPETTVDFDHPSLDHHKIGPLPCCLECADSYRQKDVKIRRVAIASFLLAWIALPVLLLLVSDIDYGLAISMSFFWSLMIAGFIGWRYDLRQKNSYQKNLSIWLREFATELSREEKHW